MVGKFKKISLILLLLPISISAQTLQPASSQESIVNIKDEKRSKGIEATSRNDAQKRTSAPRQLTFFKHKRSKEQQKRLLPNAEDLTRYAAFLAQPGTGIFKLTEDIGCDSNAYILRADEECLSTIPGGSFYSFREREYSASAVSDIRLKDGLFITDAVLSQNILVSLGDVPLENMTLNSDGMRFLKDFIPQTDVKDATDQYIKLTRGVRVGKYDYMKVFPAHVNTTYAMRVVAFKGKFLRVFRGFIYDALAGNERSDLMLAFRVIRKDSNGTTLIWKEFERKKAPKMMNLPRKKQ